MAKMLAALLSLLGCCLIAQTHRAVAAGGGSSNACSNGHGDGDGELPVVLSYYLQQEFGQNELLMVPAARAAVSGSATGFGLEIVYEFVMTKTADPASELMGYVRGTAIVVNNTAAASVFMASNVVHVLDSSNGNVMGTFSQQGEAVFSQPPWEFAILGGTGSFRRAQGYNVGTFVSSTPTPSGSRHVVTHYDTHLCTGRCSCK